MALNMKSAVTEIYDTNVTNQVHQKPYDAISPARAENSQHGRTVLITGGAGKVGSSVGKAFVQASAKAVILVGRRLETLSAAAEELRTIASSAGSPTTIQVEACDLTRQEDIESFWANLAGKGVVVDVLVSCAAIFLEPPKTILQRGVAEVWSQVEVNARASLAFAEHFCKQGTGAQKVRGPSAPGCLKP
jgi:NAD(P)-dependent dehydrogenase (short-subunit alcohol dehydrogenase family)